MDPPLIIYGIARARVGGGYGRAITNVVLGQVVRAGDEGGWRLASHEKRAGVEGVADGNVTQAIEDRVVVEYMISCYECRKDGGYVYGNHVCLGFCGGVGEETSMG